MRPPSLNRKGRLGEHALPLGLAAVLLWLVGALMVRVLPGVFESRWRTLVACLALVPLAELMLLLLGAVFGLEPAKRLPAAAWLGIVMLACHVMALVLWPQLYGTDDATVRHGTAWLMWAAATPIASAWFRHERA
jgi:hypothetical protein